MSSKYDVELEKKCFNIFGESNHYHQILDGLIEFNTSFQDYSHLSEDIQNALKKLEDDFKYVFGYIGSFLEYYQEFGGDLNEYLKGKMSHFHHMNIRKNVLNYKIDRVKEKAYQDTFLNFIQTDIKDLNLFLYGDGVNPMEIFNQGAYYFYQKDKRPSNGVFGYCSNYIKYRIFDSWWNRTH